MGHMSAPLQTDPLYPNPALHFEPSVGHRPGRWRGYVNAWARGQVTCCLHVPVKENF